MGTCRHSGCDDGDARALPWEESLRDSVGEPPVGLTAGILERLEAEGLLPAAPEDPPDR